MVREPVLEECDVLILLLRRADEVGRGVAEPLARVVLDDLSNRTCRDERTEGVPVRMLVLGLRVDADDANVGHAVRDLVFAHVPHAGVGNELVALHATARNVPPFEVLILAVLEQEAALVVVEYDLDDGDGHESVDELVARVGDEPLVVLDDGQQLDELGLL